MDFFYKNKRHLTIITLFFYIFFLYGCAPKEVDKSNGVVNESIEGYPTTITDYLDRKVTISKPAERIACGYSFVAHVAAMLGKGDKLVSSVAGIKRDKVLTDMYPYIEDLPIPFTAGTVNVEELLASKPDIIFIKAKTALNESETSKLDKLKVPYVVVDFESMEEQMESVLNISKALGAEEKANEYVDYYKKIIEDTKKITDTIPDEERVSVFHSINEASRTDNKDSLGADWLKIVGVNNVSVDKQLRLVEEKFYANLEQIYLWDPDIIIAHEIGVPEYILTNEQWTGLRCVKEKKVYQIPNGISRWGHPGSIEVPLAILWTSKLVYPKYFEHIDMVEETKDFYKRFLNLDLSNEDVNKILTSSEEMRIPRSNDKDIK